MSKSNETFVHVSLAIEVDECNPVVVNIHDGDRIGVTLIQGLQHAYLRGTPDELHWLCDKLRAVVTAHESSTRLAGEAAERVVDAARIPSFDQWLRNQGIKRDSLDVKAIQRFRIEWVNATNSVIA